MASSGKCSSGDEPVKGALPPSSVLRIFILTLLLLWDKNRLKIEAKESKFFITVLFICMGILTFKNISLFTFHVIVETSDKWGSLKRQN